MADIISAAAVPTQAARFSSDHLGSELGDGSWEDASWEEVLEATFEKLSDFEEIMGPQADTTTEIAVETNRNIQAPGMIGPQDDITAEMAMEANLLLTKMVGKVFCDKSIAEGSALLPQLLASVRSTLQSETTG